MVTDDVVDAAERLQACVDNIVGLAKAMKADEFADILKVDGGDMISDAVQLATAWFHKVQGLYAVKKVAAAMTYRSEPPSGADGVTVGPKKRARQKGEK